MTIYDVFIDEDGLQAYDGDHDKLSVSESSIAELRRDLVEKIRNLDALAPLIEMYGVFYIQSAYKQYQETRYLNRMIKAADKYAKNKRDKELGTWHKECFDKRDKIVEDFVKTKTWFRKNYHEVVRNYVISRFDEKDQEDAV